MPKMMVLKGFTPEVANDFRSVIFCFGKINMKDDEGTNGIVRSHSVQNYIPKADMICLCEMMFQYQCS